MATGSNGYPPLLILSNSVYAKRADGGFYPASVESKDNGNYTVRFPDGRSELVLEDNLIWLGFWGMPPSNWPKNPVIIPTMASWETIGNKSMVVRDNNDPNDQETASFARQRADETRMSNENDEPCGRDLDVWHGLVGGERVAKMPKHVLPRQTDASQSRSSVLRISSSALSKDGNTNDFRNFISSHPDESTKAERLSHSPSDTSQSQRYHKGRPWDFDSNHISTAQRMSDTTERNGTLKRRASYENPSEKEIHKYSYKRERGVSLSDVDLSDNEEQESQKSSTSSEPESPYKAFTAANASQFIASQFPFLNPACGLTVFAAAQNATIPSSFRLHTGFNKKPEKKKCRKMYGIENRQFWCTQCKWKKACTRFGNEIVPDGIA